MALAPTPGGRVGDTSSLARPGYKGKRRTSNYERQIAHALMRKRGMSKSRAIAMARGLLNKAARTGRWGDKGKASGPVRAGAAASIAQRASFSNVAVADTMLSVTTKPKTRTVARIAAAEVVRRLDKLDIDLSNISVPKEIDLAGTGGAKWRHGWVPLNAVAAAIKAKRYAPGSSGGSRAGKTRQRFVAESNGKVVGSVSRSKGKPPRGLIEKSSPFAKLANDMRAGKHGPAAKAAVLKTDAHKPGKLGQGGGVHGPAAAKAVAEAERTGHVAAHPQTGNGEMSPEDEQKLNARKAALSRQNSIDKRAVKNSNLDAGTHPAEARIKERNSELGRINRRLKKHHEARNGPKPGSTAAADAAIARMGTQQIRDMLNDRRYASWGPKLRAELAKRKK